MFRCIEYTAFLWKAKGRHGTHSPFAYWLVDGVARLPKASINLNSNGIRSKKTNVFIDKLNRALPQYAIKIIGKKGAEIGNISDLEPQIIVFEAPLDVDCCQQILESRFHPESMIILPQSANKKDRRLFEQLYANARFHFTANCFHFSILSPRPGQAKQHFYLKLAWRINNL